eukprot:3432232-Rhodomonas_salina.2
MPGAVLPASESLSLRLRRGFSALSGTLSNCFPQSATVLSDCFPQSATVLSNCFPRSATVLSDCFPRSATMLRDLQLLQVPLSGLSLQATALAHADSWRYTPKSNTGNRKSMEQLVPQSEGTLQVRTLPALTPARGQVYRHGPVAAVPGDPYGRGPAQMDSGG